MSDEQDKLKLSLEPPKLFGRKKKSDAMGTSKSTSPAPATGQPPASDESEPPDEEATAEVVEETQAEELESAPSEPAPAGPAEPVAEDDEESEPVDDVVTPEPEPEPAPVPEPEPGPAPQKAAKPALAAKATPAAKTAPVQPAAKKPAATSGAVARTPVRPRAKLAPDIEPEPLTRIDEEDAEIAAHADEPPLLPLYPAAAVTGAVVGAGMVLLIWLSLRGCEAVRDTSSCTGGPGFLLLVATFVVCVLLGSALLKVFSIPDPGSSSFLAVGLVAVVALLFLIDVLDHWSMLIVIPVVGVGGFLASVWITKTFVDDTDTG
ncbi:hypothetical protein [Nocardioides bizhenqiangii]|uniref:Uncharacterized protein n=1 Tax=Nocardioides bizhenqiangii TaxID=3095076 RepID=A0ABZ0ZT87_9ACTN|nr:hypothetical protein [Nocardioides sp. HM61]WQQ26867.1 hypothetical protein SHK19_01225 [Nocardioides sp. HM61]